MLVTYQDTSRLFASAAMALGLLAGLGWALDIATFKSPLPGAAQATMKPSTASLVLVGGLALWLSYPAGRPIRRMAASAGALYLMAVCAAYLALSPLHSVSSTWLLAPSASTCLVFATLGLALFLLMRRWQTAGIVGLLALGAGLLALYRLLSFALGPVTVATTGPLAGMALNTALAALFIAAGVLCHPALPFCEGVCGRDARGRLLRRNLPLVCLIPILLSIAMSFAIQLDSGGHDHDWIEAEVIFLVLAICLIGCSVVWRLANILYLTDIALHQAKLHGQEADAQAKLYLEVAEVFVVVLDREGRISLINRKGCELLGQTQAELLGRAWTEFCAPEAREPWARFYANLMAGQANLQELAGYAIAGRSGETHFLEWRRYLLRDAGGLPSGVVSCGLDVTKERHAKQALSQYQSELEQTVRARTADLALSEARSRAVLASMLDGVVLIDATGRMIAVNDAIERMFGYEEEELVGCNVSLLMPEPYRSAHDGYMRRYLESRQAKIIGQRREVPAQRKDGSVFPIELAVNELVDDAGSTFLGVIHDISLRKQAEQAQEQARCEAERLARLKSEFLANMSHEIRTPLNAVLGMARIGMREGQGQKTGEVCERILDSGQHLLGVVNDILDFSKIEAGKLAVESRPLPLLGTIDHVASFIGDSAAAKGLGLRLEVANGMPEWVLGDALRLSQVLINLLSNAVKFTHAGEVSLTVTREGETSCFRVSDSGIGMSAEELRRLFTPFEQAEGGITRRYGGSGLGLAISRQLAKLMGGEIEVESSLGRGSVFTLCLPLPPAAQPEHVPQADAAAPAGPRLPGVRVLAAEDVAVNRLVLEDILAQEGAQVVFGEDGQQALDRIGEMGADAFDVVLMDVQMPVMGGHEAARRLGQMAPGLPIIGLTAHALIEERERCIAAGMVDHVTKPIDPDVLVAAILRQLAPRTEAASAAPSPVQAAPPAQSAPLAEAGLIDWPALLERFNHRRAFIDKLAATAVASHGQTPAKVREAAGRNDLAALAFIAHGLKGMGGNLEAPAVSALARQVESEARAGEAAAAESALALAEMLDALLAELARGMAMGERSDA